MFAYTVTEMGTQDRLCVGGVYDFVVSNKFGISRLLETWIMPEKMY